MASSESNLELQFKHPKPGIWNFFDPTTEGNAFTVTSHVQGESRYYSFEDCREGKDPSRNFAQILCIYGLNFPLLIFGAYCTGTIFEWLLQGDDECDPILPRLCI